MRIDQDQILGETSAPDNAATQHDSAAFIGFVLRGHDYVLVNYREWLAEQETRPLARQGDPPVVGRIVIDGERHVIMESPAPPAADGDLAKVELGDLLTKRELQVALLVAEGNCDKQIARRLGISGYTVREHIRRTFAKLNVSRRAAIVAHVLRHMSKPIDRLGHDHSRDRD
jgi:DNA-binding CsgD family transcriptional regulator